VSVPSSELGPHPFLRKRMCLPPGLKGGSNTLLRMWGWGTQFGRLVRKPWHSVYTLCFLHIDHCAMCWVLIREKLIVGLLEISAGKNVTCLNGVLIFSSLSWQLYLYISAIFVQFMVRTYANRQMYSIVC